MKVPEVDLNPGSYCERRVQTREPPQHKKITSGSDETFRYENIQSFSGTNEKLWDSQIHFTFLHVQQKLTGFVLFQFLSGFTFQWLLLWFF